MPMLADLDDPPRSRARGLLFGLLAGIPLAAVLVGWLIPLFVKAVLGGAHELDAHLRQQDAYMQELCTSAIDPDRDRMLCECVFAVEFPALDCQEPFRTWALARAEEQCRDETVKKRAISYCSCIETVSAELADVGPDDDTRMRQVSQAYDRCAALPDAISLPDATLGAASAT